MTPDVQLSYTIHSFAVSGLLTADMIAQFKAHYAYSGHQVISENLFYVDMLDSTSNPEELLEFVRRVMSERSEEMEADGAATN